MVPVNCFFFVAGGGAGAAELRTAGDVAGAFCFFFLLIFGQGWFRDM